MTPEHLKEVKDAAWDSIPITIRGTVSYYYWSKGFDLGLSGLKPADKLSRSEEFGYQYGQTARLNAERYERMIPLKVNGYAYVDEASDNELVRLHDEAKANFDLRDQERERAHALLAYIKAVGRLRALNRKVRP